MLERGKRLFLVTSVSKGAEGPLILEQDLLELLELGVLFGIHSLQVLHVLDHHLHSLAHPALLREWGKQHFSGTASHLEISPSSISSPLLSYFYPPFQSFTTTPVLAHGTQVSFLWGITLVVKSTNQSINLQFAKLLQLIIITSSDLYFSAATMNLLVLPSHFYAALGYYTQLHLTFEQDLVIWLISCPFHKEQNHLCSIKAIVTTLLGILYISLLQSLYCLVFFNQNLISAVGVCTF